MALRLRSSEFNGTFRKVVFAIPYTVSKGKKSAIAMTNNA
jgi:hypothetical protein